MGALPAALLAAALAAPCPALAASTGTTDVTVVAFGNPPGQVSYVVTEKPQAPASGGLLGSAFPRTGDAGLPLALALAGTAAASAALLARETRKD